MAFVTKYITKIKNRSGDIILVEIQEDGFTGTSEYFVAIGGDPINITHETNINKKHSYIIPSMARIGVHVNNKWDLYDLLYSTDRAYKVLITNNTTSQEIFRGWLISAVSTMDYTAGRYMVTLMATDGLADLKKTKYLNSGALYDVFQAPRDVISNVLAKTSLYTSNALWENIDIYAAAGMTTTETTHSPLNQSYIHSSAYGETVDDVMSCWDILTKILQAFHCRLFQYSDIDGSGSVWYMSKIDRLDSTSIYRYFSGSAVTKSKSNVPLLAMGTDITHINGKAQIGIKQAYKEIKVSTNRGSGLSLLDGDNFEDGDFDGGGVLNDWVNPTTHFAKYSIGTFTANATTGGSYKKQTDDGKTVLGLYSNIAYSNMGITSITGNGATATVVTAAAHGYFTLDYIHIIDNSWNYDGAYRITKINATSFTFAHSSTVVYTGGFARNLNGVRAMHLRMGYGGELSELSNDGLIEITINAKKLSTDPCRLPVGIYANLGTGTSDDSFFVTSNFSGWQSGDKGVMTNYAFSFLEFSFEEYSDQKITVNLAGMNLTSAELFLVIGEPSPSSIYINSIKARGVSQSDAKETTTTIEANNHESLDIDFFHADSDAISNDEFQYSNSIFDDATPKRFITSWKQGGAAADNLEDIIGANLVALYDDNSQTWKGTIKGDINIMSAVKDPFNLDRVFQIQSISKNLTSNFHDVGMIEANPSKAYYIEIANSATTDDYYLSSSYGDISALFASGTIQISDIRRKSDNVLIEIGNVTRTLSGAATFSGGRVIINVSDADWVVAPGSALEVKGILRIND